MPSSDEFFPLVETSGSPYERGYQHGTAVPERVRRSVDLYRSQLESRGVPGESLMKLADAMVPVIQNFEPSYLEEMQGIADGAGLVLTDIIVINCRTEMMYGYADLQKTSIGLDGGCTGLIVLPQASASGRLMHAHNWDWLEESINTGIVLKIMRDDGPHLLVFTEAGCLGRHGFNSAGVSLSGNFLTSDRDYKLPANAPLGLIRRKMLDAPSMAAAMRVLWSTHRFCSNNLMLAHADGEAVNLECAPDEIFWIVPQDGLLVHANHWMCPVARTKLKDLELPDSPDSIYRQRRVAETLRKAQGKIDWNIVKAALADDFGNPDSVLRFPKPASFDCISATVATTLMDSAAKTMWVARKPYASIVFGEYRL
ncbi:MAG: C45 family autoproteolytic acyltransferase/hydrolase [Proteobacteria bacterium]|nr:C45 family autoproteolytic acyltransferase/hydrolase [Pseudomonadota bacterium]